MQKLPATLLIAIFVGLFLCLIGTPIFVAVTQRRRSRFRILAEGQGADGVITNVTPDARQDTCRVHFSFQPETCGPRIECKQESSLAVVQRLGLGQGSQIRVRYQPTWPRYAFADSLIIAERLATLKSITTSSSDSKPLAPSVYFISYGASHATAAPTRSRWSGDGDITIGGEAVRFTAQIARPFWYPKTIQEEFAISAVSNVEVFDNTVRCEISVPYAKPRALQFRAISPEEANAIGAQLPDRRTSTFAPQLAESAAFQTNLLKVSPRAPITPVLCGINVTLFVIAVALGGGILVPNGDVLVRLGSDYTPLTAAGQWWRLLTSTFLHFGLAHLGFNMWALWVNGVVAERLYGSTRYLLLYLVAGVAGSLASFLWHPFVNGAGASGAIFGVLGAVFAYFLRTDSGVPKSVLMAQRKNAALFIVVSVLNGVRIRGIDNAAHLGGLVAGFVMGSLLRRPLDAKRDEQDWTGQWIRSLAVLVSSVLFVGYYLSNGQWHPRVLRDPSGRPILPAELIRPPRTFGGITLGMTSAEVLHAKGRPVRQEPDDWIYNSIDPAHDGVLEAYFRNSPDGRSAMVWAVLFWGTHDTEPRGMPSLLGFKRQDLVARYGTPAADANDQVGDADNSDASYLYFHNGIMVRIEEDKVKAYGVYLTPE